MSFILDALRKSEHERQRTAMPGIAQVPFGLPRREMPPWAYGVIVLLALALLTLAGALWRSTWPDAERDRAANVPARDEIPLPLPSPPAASESRADFESADGPDSAAAAVPGRPSDLRDARTATPPAPPAATAEPGASAPSPENRAAESEPSETEQTLPSAAALAAQGISVPTLRLELVAYAQRPAERFVFINGTKYSEGATLAEGPRLVAIAPNGAILSYLGHRFLLSPQ